MVADKKKLIVLLQLAIKSTMHNAMPSLLKHTFILYIYIYIDMSEDNVVVSSSRRSPS